MLVAQYLHGRRPIMYKVASRGVVRRCGDWVEVQLAAVAPLKRPAINLHLCDRRSANNPIKNTTSQRQYFCPSAPILPFEPFQPSTPRHDRLLLPFITINNPFTRRSHPLIFACTISIRTIHLARPIVHIETGCQRFTPLPLSEQY